MRVRQTGFTLIELVAVVVLLGILAVAALPRFINLQGDARAGVLQGVAGSMRSATTQVYAKALMQGSSTTANQTVTNGPGVTLEVDFGYPKATAAGAGNQDIVDLIDLTAAGGDITDTAVAAAGPVAAHVRVGYNNADNGCYVAYFSSTAVNTQPVINVVTAGCQ